MTGMSADPNFLNQVLSQWLMEIRVVRMRRVPISTRLKRRRYYRKKKSAIKRKQRMARKRPAAKRKAKRRRKLRKRMRLKPGSRKRIRLATAQELSGRLMESTQVVNAVHLIEAFQTAKDLAHELIRIESRLAEQPRPEVVHEWSLPSIDVPKLVYGLTEDIDDLFGEASRQEPKYDSPEAILRDCDYMIESLQTYSIDLADAHSILVLMTEWLDRSCESLATEARENPRIYFDKNLSRTDAQKIVKALEAELNIDSAVVADQASIELVGARPTSDEIRQAVEASKVRNKIQHISDVQGEAMQEAEKHDSVRIYDNGGKTVDRYTVVVDRGNHKDFYGLARDPSMFNQFLGQDSDGFVEGSHLGKLISLDKLSPAAKKAVQDRVDPELDEQKKGKVVEKQQKAGDKTLAGKSDLELSKMSGMKDLDEEKLQLWKRPDNYSGEDLSDYYVGPSQHRDSDILQQSNFAVALERLGGEDGEKVTVGRFGHWGSGWMEQILVHKDAKDKVAILKKIVADLERYPVLDEDDFFERERAELDDIFDSNRDKFVSNLAKVAGKSDDEISKDEEKALEDIARMVLDWANGYYGLEGAWVDARRMKHMSEHDWADIAHNVKHPILAAVKAGIEGN